MPTNEQRRATAKRKLERQLERRAKQARTRRILLIVGGSIVAVAVVAAVVITVINSKNEHKSNIAAPTTPAGSSAASTTTAPQTGPVPPLPPFKPSADLGANCQYPPSPDRAAKPVKPPRTGKIPTDPPTMASVRRRRACSARRSSCRSSLRLAVARRCSLVGTAEIPPWLCAESGVHLTKGECAS